MKVKGRRQSSNVMDIQSPLKGQQNSLMVDMAGKQRRRIREETPQMDNWTRLTNITSIANPQMVLRRLFATPRLNYMQKFKKETE